MTGDITPGTLGNLCLDVRGSQVRRNSSSSPRSLLRVAAIWGTSDLWRFSLILCLPAAVCHSRERQVRHVPSYRLLSSLVVLCIAQNLGGGYSL